MQEKEQEKEKEWEQVAGSGKKTEEKREQRVLEEWDQQDNMKQRSWGETGSGLLSRPREGPPSMTSMLRDLATHHCNNMVTRCCGATTQWSTLARMVHPNVEIGNTAHSALDGHDVTECGSSGMHHGKETATKNCEMDSGAPLFPGPCEEMRENGVFHAMPCSPSR